MKTILISIICLWFSVGVGQDNWEENDTCNTLDWRYDGAWRNPATSNPSHSTKAHEALLPITREDLFRYAEECWNDSTFSLFSVYSKPYRAREYDPIWEQDIIRKKKIWHHHKKPTFPGFIEWLKRNMRKKYND